MFDKIKKGLKNFAHNLLSITHSLFGTALVVGGIVSFVFFGFPFVPVLCYGIILAVIGTLLFNAAHRVVDFFANMFDDTTTTPDVTVASNEPTATINHTHTQSSTQAIKTGLENHPVKTTIKQVKVSSTETNNNKKELNSAANTVDISEEPNTATAMSNW